MIAVVEFLPRLMPYVVGCPEPMATQALVDSAIAFCNDSLALHSVLEAQQTQINNPEFDIGVATGQAVCRVLRVWVNDREIKGAAVDQINDAGGTSGQPRMFYTRQIDSVLTALLHPTPDAVYSLRVEVATRPTRAAKSFENDLFDLWLEPVIEGAKARLMAIPDQPFSNPGAAVSAAANAMYLSRKARVEGSYGRTRATGRVQARPLA